MRDKYYAVSRDGADYYSTALDVVNNLHTFIPPEQESLSSENRVVVYKLPAGFETGRDEADLSYDDVYFEFYDNKLHYSDGRVVKYHKPEKKNYLIAGSDGKKYNVKAYTKLEAERILKNYLKRTK